VFSLYTHRDSIKCSIGKIGSKNPALGVGIFLTSVQKSCSVVVVVMDGGISLSVHLSGYAIKVKQKIIVIPIVIHAIAPHRYCSHET
jgi:hypothetical protein